MPPKIVSDVAVRIEPGSQVPCSATGTPPIYIALIQNFTVLMNTTNTASSKLYQEGNYTCVATNKYGSDVKHFIMKGGEKIRYFETKPMYRVAIGGRGWRHVIFMSQEKLQTMIMQFFFLEVGGGGGRGFKNVYYGICASRELR